MPSPDSPATLAPRVLLVMPDQWPRALLRAALREGGYDALGAPGLVGALRYRATAPERGPVRLVLVDQAALEDEEAATLLRALLRRHADPALVLLARAMPPRSLPAAASGAPWRSVIRRPTSVADLVAGVQELLPLPAELRHPID